MSVDLGRASHGTRHSAIALEPRVRTARPVVGDGRQAPLLRRALEAQPAARQPFAHHCTATLNEAPFASPPVSELDRSASLTPLVRAPLAKLRHDVPGAPFGARRILEAAVAHASLALRGVSPPHPPRRRRLPLSQCRLGARLVSQDVT